MNFVGVFDMGPKQQKGKTRPIKVLYTVQNERRLILPFTLLLANKFLNMIGFVDYIDRSVEWDRKHWKVTPGNLAKAVILVTFLQIRAPLYKIKGSFIGIDTEALFGEGVMPEHLNDDAIARALDRISQVKSERLFSTLCLSLYSKFDIAFKRLHSDTTTLSFYGDYEESEEGKTDELKVVKGYNKDGRPECKQVVVGKIVNEHGIAIAGSTMDGNTSDIEWNQKALALVKEMFSERLNEVTYIADSKLINLPTFRQLMEPERKIRFISRCPSNFYDKVAGKCIRKAYQSNQWRKVGRIGKGEKACTYQIQEFTQDIEGYDTRMIVVQSSAGAERFIRKMDQYYEKLEKDIFMVSQKTFACEADVRKEWERFQKAHRNNLLRCTAEFQEEKIEKRPRGNPGKNPKPPKIESIWHPCIRIEGEDDAAVENLRQEEECFVLITCIAETELDGADVLRQYKDQSIVEVQFKILKEPALASTIFLKTPERINALVMLLNVSLLIRALIQYKIRKSITESQEELPRIGWDNRKLENPTIKFVIEALQNSYLTKIADAAYHYDFCNELHKLRVTTIFRLLGVSIEELLE
jgi:transposase